jgi:hypothetical protein
MLDIYYPSPRNLPLSGVEEIYLSYVVVWIGISILRGGNEPQPMTDIINHSNSKILSINTLE